jgi:hypothetical protein
MMSGKKIVLIFMLGNALVQKWVLTFNVALFWKLYLT